MLLELRGIESGYGNVRVLHGVDLAVVRGSVSALVGANGAGKTTLMRTVAGLQPVVSGTLRLDGRDIGGDSASARVEAGIALVPEGRMLFPTFSVEENLRLGAISPRARSGAAERLESLYELFPRLRERHRQSAASLSGGEQQMLALARGLMARPDLLLLDEPTLGLAPIMSKQIFVIIERLRQDGLTILIAEQNVQRALELADVAYVVENGRVTLSGRGAEMLDDPRVRSAYLGV